MLKKVIKYTDFDGEKQEDVCYFYISQPELVELDVASEGLGRLLERIYEEKDNKKMLEWFNTFIRLSYGEKSEDGKRFVKRPELVEAFMQTPAYEALYMELLTDAEACAAFVKGFMPADIQRQAEELELVAKQAEQNTSDARAIDAKQV